MRRHASIVVPLVAVLALSVAETQAGAANVSPASAFQVRLQLMPQSLDSVLRHGMEVRISADQPADGIATVTISRAAARSAHLGRPKAHTGAVVVGRGTVSGIKKGTMRLRVRMSRGMTRALGHLRKLTLTLRLTLQAKNGVQATDTVVGEY